MTFQVAFAIVALGVVAEWAGTKVLFMNASGQIINPQDFSVSVTTFNLSGAAVVVSLS